MRKEDQAEIGWGACTVPGFHSLLHLLHCTMSTGFNIPTIDIYSLRAITKLRHLDIAFEEEELSTEKIELYINDIQSKATTPEEQALGHFTRRKLKTMETWPEWEFGERKQLNQFE